MLASAPAVADPNRLALSAAAGGGHSDAETLSQHCPFGTFPHSQALIEHWNGHRWAPVTSAAIPGSGLADVLALTPHLAWAVGSYFPRSRVNRTLIERWNGHAWTLVSSPNRGPSSELLGIAGTQHHLWAVGDSLTTTISTLILRH